MDITHPHIRKILLATASFAGIVGAPAAHAQSAQSSEAPQAADAVESEGVETIVVTAQKRAQNMQDVPISMVAVSGDAMVRAGVSNLDSLQHYAPGLTRSIRDPIRASPSSSTRFISAEPPGFSSTCSTSIGWRC
jgi:iron complex outermembrane receptor protein